MQRCCLNIANEIGAFGWRPFTTYKIRLQAVLDFPAENYAFSNQVESEAIRTRAECMLSIRNYFYVHT